MQIAPINPANEAHVRFVFDAVRKRSYDWPWTRSDERLLVDTCERNLVSNPRGCLIAHAPDDADLFYGYVLTDGPQLVTFAYTKDALRGPGAFNAPVGTPVAHAPVCTSLLSAAGTDVSKTTAVRIWSRVASRICERGYPLFPVPVW